MTLILYRDPLGDDILSLPHAFAGNSNAWSTTLLRGIIIFRLKDYKYSGVQTFTNECVYRFSINP